MINLKFDNEIYSIKNKLDEITIEEFENICEIVVKYSDDEIDKWIEIFKYLGLPQNVCDNFDYQDILRLSSFYQFITQPINLKIIKKYIIVNNVKYYFINKNRKIKIKNLIDIENYSNRDKFKYIAEMMSVLYPSNNKSEHINNIRQNLTMDNVIPIINYLNKEFFNGN